MSSVPMELMLRQLTDRLTKLTDRIYTPLVDLDVRAWRTTEPVPFARRRSGEPLHLRPGDVWGRLFECAWFHFTGRVPNAAQGKNVVLLIDVNGEACVVDAVGNPVQGLTNLNSEFNLALGKPGKRVVPLSLRARGGQKVDLWADAGMNDLFGKVQGGGTVKEACIAVCNEPLRQLHYDTEVLLTLAKHLPVDSARQARIVQALMEASQQLRDFTESEALAARRILEPELARRNGDVPLRASAIGHGHIDLAWLWPVRETIRKGARTFSTALRFMDRYPEYVFGASQPQLYQWIKDRYPGLYSRVKKAIAAGRWEAQGAMWVEADTNISGGEALVRQILLGKRFFRKEFGQDTKVLWLPDVFGYSGALPQLLRKAGVEYFCTIKISWNSVNKFPYHTFHWQGIDGSKVLAHMPPEGTYNSSASPQALLKAEHNFREKHISDQMLVLFGIGDGGGGPGEEHIERLGRQKNLLGVPPVRQEPAERFFRRLSKDAGQLPAWSGELYLERHQGTFTTQARSKRYNRKIEIALRDLEFAACLAGRLGRFAYPAAELDAIWKEMLLYQFHDILPGSSITRVYKESLARYASMLARVEELTGQAWEQIAQRINTGEAGKPVLIGNSLSWPRSQWLKLGRSWRQVSAPAMGYAIVDASAAADKPESPTATRTRLENDLLRVTFDGGGAITSIFDKQARREVLRDGQVANRLRLYADPGNAWDFPEDYADLPYDDFRLETATPSVDGPQASLRQSYVFGQSRLSQTVILTAGSRRLGFVTHVDWREPRRMLRTSFPVRVQTDTATCEIQFGSIARPTHTNTSWDMAKEEVPAHKWVDLSQGDYGVALLNDCKYGYKVRGNVLDLNLLRSSYWPDRVADLAEHDFTYSLLPHAGNHIAGRVIQEAYELNVPLCVRPAKPRKATAPASFSLVEISEPAVVLEAIKKAEDGEELIVRLYESHGAGCTTKIRFGIPVRSVALVDLLEERPQPLRCRDNQVELSFGPFEIHTLRVKIGPRKARV